MIVYALFLVNYVTKSALGLMAKLVNLIDLKSVGCGKRLVIEIGYEDKRTNY